MKIQKMIAIVLAAGKGTRMNSPLPKVLHTLASKTLIEHVLSALTAVPVDHTCLVLNEQLEPFTDLLNKHPLLNVCIQKNLTGTATAVASASLMFREIEPISYAPSVAWRKMQVYHPHDYVLICFGDTPLIEADLLRQFVTSFQKSNSDLGVLGVTMTDPHGYGRLVLETGGTVKAIVEERDADPETKKIRHCNSGIMLAQAQTLFHLLAKVQNHNAQQEFYLTEIVAIANQESKKVFAFMTHKWEALLGVNTQEQLNRAESIIQG